MKCGIYLRISKEEAGSTSESNSISGQRLIIKQYMECHSELEFVSEWCDDGYSGISFERPGIQNAINAAITPIRSIVVNLLMRFFLENTPFIANG